MGINGIVISNDSANIKSKFELSSTSSCTSSDFWNSSEIAQDEYNQEDIERKKEELKKEINLLYEQYDAKVKELKKKELEKKLMYCPQKIKFNPTFNGMLGLLAGASGLGAIGGYISSKLMNIGPHLTDKRANFIVGAATIFCTIAGGVFANKLESDGYIVFRRGTERAKPVFELVDKGSDCNNKRYNRAKEFEESEIRPLEQERDVLLELIIQKVKELNNLEN